MEGASTLVVLLEENKTTPCSLSQLWFKTHLQSSGCGRIHSTGGVIYLPLYQTSLWCLSLIPLLSFTVTWAEQRLWVVEKVLPAGSISTIVCSGVWDLDEPTCRCPCLGLGVTVFLQRPRESGPQKGL